MGIRKKAAKGILWSSVNEWGRNILRLIIYGIFARLLGPVDIGLVAMALVFTNFAQIFVAGGFSAAIVQRKEIDVKHLDTAFWGSVGMSVVLAAILILGSGLIADLLNQPRLGPAIGWLALVLPLNALNIVQRSNLRRSFSFKKVAIRDLTSIVIGGSVGIVMAATGYGIWSLIVQQLVRNFVIVLFLWKVGSWSPGFNFSYVHFKELFSFGSSVLGARMLQFVSNRSDKFLIGAFLGPAALGYYDVGYRIIEVIVQTLTGAVQNVALSAFSKLQDNHARLREAFYQIIKMSGVIVFPVFLGLAVFAEPLTLVLFGSKWLPSVPVMQVLAFIGIIQSVDAFNTNIMFATGKPWFRLSITFFDAITNIVVFFFAVQYGIVWVAAAFVIRGYLYSPIPILVVKHLIQISIKKYLQQLIIPMSAAVAMALIVFPMRQLLTSSGNTVTLIVGIGTGIIIYGGIVFIFSRSTLNEFIQFGTLAFSRTTKN